MPNSDLLLSFFQSKEAAETLLSKGGVPRDLSGANLSGKDFSGMDLSGMDFSEADLSGANFGKCQLIGVNFSGADLRGANFKKAEMFGSSFGRAELRNAIFENANLTAVDLRNADLSSSRLHRCSLNRALVDCSIESANSSSVSTEYRGVYTYLFNSPYCRVLARAPHSYFSKVLATDTSEESGAAQKEEGHVRLLLIVIIGYFYFFVAGFLRGFSWVLSGTLGRVNLLTRASYLALALVPILAWFWPLVRSAVNNYNLGLSEAVLLIDRSVAALSEIAEKTERLSPELQLSIDQLNSSASILMEKVGSELLSSPDLPLSLTAVFFAAVSVTIGHALVETLCPDVVRSHSKSEFVNSALSEWSSCEAKSEKTQEYVYALKNAAEANPDKFHPNLAPCFGQIVWWQDSLMTERDYDSLGESNPKGYNRQVGKNIVAAWAEQKYDIEARRGLFWSALSCIFYVVGILLVLFVVFRQGLVVAEQSGILA